MKMRTSRDMSDLPRLDLEPWPWHRKLLYLLWVLFFPLAVRQKRKSEQSEGNEIALDITVNGGFLLEGAEPPADAAGRCWIGDKLYRISGLVKTAATGQKYYSLTFQLDDV